MQAEWGNRTMFEQPLSILLAEDDEGQAYLIQQNLRRSGVAAEIIHVTDGQSALDYVRGEGAYTNRPQSRSLLVVLDINMPRRDGIDVLSALKASEATAKIPVVMFTTGNDPGEIARCYAIGCSAYIPKPIDYEGFVEAVDQLGRILVQIPGEADHRAAYLTCPSSIPPVRGCGTEHATPSRA